MRIHQILISLLWLCVRSTVALPRRGAFVARSQSSSTCLSTTRLHAGYGKPAPAVDPYSSLLNKVDGGVPTEPAPQAFTKAALEKVPVPDEAAIKAAAEQITSPDLKAIEEMTKSVTDAANEAAAAAASISTEVANTATVEIDPLSQDVVSEGISKMTEGATTAATSIAASFDSAFKSVVGRTVPAMKAKGAATAAVAAGSAPTLVDFVKNGGSGVPSTESPGANVLEKLSIMKQNFINMERSVGFDPDALNGVGSFNFNDLLDTLRVKELGAWYVVAATLIVAMGQRNVGKEEARRLLEQELKLAEEKAAIAADAASRAAEGAKKVKELVFASKSKESSNKLLEQSKLREMEVEREMMEKKLEVAVAEANKLKAQLKELLNPGSSATKGSRGANAAHASSSTSAAAATKAVAPQPPTKEEIEEDEDSKDRVLAAIKAIDDENRKKRPKKATAKAAPPKKAAAKRKAAPKKAASTVAKGAAVQPEKAPTPVAAVKETPANAAPVKEVPTHAASEVVAPPKKQAVAVKEVSPVSVAKKAPTTNGTTKPAAKTAPKKADKAEAHPWASLADSTLSRKTVADLTAFLKERGEETKGGDGKPLLKRELLSKVKSLL